MQFCSNNFSAVHWSSESCLISVSVLHWCLQIMWYTAGLQWLLSKHFHWRSYARIYTVKRFEKPASSLASNYKLCCWHHLPSAEFSNCPVCSLTTIPFLSAPGLGHCITWNGNPPLAHTPSVPVPQQPQSNIPAWNCSARKRALISSTPISQPTLLTKPALRRDFHTGVWKKLHPPPNIFEHCVSLSPANVLGRLQGRKGHKGPQRLELHKLGGV